jgi:putative MATE family efflux protein
MQGNKNERSVFPLINAEGIGIFLKEIKEAISGTDRDFTETKPGHAIFILAIPMVLEMVMESVFAIVDIFFVSRLGANAVATVGITESVMTIVYSIGSGLSMATTALVARRVGQKRAGDAGVVAFQSILAGIFISLIIAVPGILFAREFLLLMGATEEMAEEGALYPAIMFGSNSVIMLLFIINAVFRSSGDAAVSMRVVWVAIMINLVLDPLFIFGLGPIPGMGLAGAAIATSIGRGLGVIYQFYILFRGNYRIKLFAESIRVKIGVMLELLQISGGGIFQNLIATSSWIILVRIIAISGGTEALAGYTIAIRIVLFSLLPAGGISNAAATLVGQNLGALHPERAEKSIRISAWVNMLFMGILSLMLILFPSFFIELFINDPLVIQDGALALRTISYGFVFYALGMVIVQGFNGSGDTFTPMLINIVSFWFIEIPLAWFLAVHLHMGLEGASIAIVCAESLMTIIAFLLFRRGKWKLRQV